MSGAVVTYIDGSTTTVNQAVNLGQPTVNSFSVSTSAFVWQQFPWNPTPGLTAGISYTASVTMPQNDGGTFGIVQLVSGNITVININFVIHAPVIHVYPIPGPMLDNRPNAPQNGMFVSAYTQSVGAGQTALIPPANSPGTIVDWPNQGPVMSANETPSSISMDLQFQDYLVYQPARGGIWVQIATIPQFNLTGTASYQNNQWVVTASSPAQPKINGAPALGFVSWGNYANGNPIMGWLPSF